MTDPNTPPTVGQHPVAEVGAMGDEQLLDTLIDAVVDSGKATDRSTYMSTLYLRGACNRELLRRLALARTAAPEGKVGPPKVEYGAYIDGKWHAGVTPAAPEGDMWATMAAHVHELGVYHSLRCKEAGAEARDGYRDTLREIERQIIAEAYRLAAPSGADHA